MKEQTYGWYPSMKDVYTDRRMGAPNAYQIEAMYKFRDSKYYTAPHPPTPRTSNAFRPTPTPPKRPMTVASNKSRSSRSESSLQVRAKSAPIYDFKPVPRLQVPTPHQCWSTNVPETPHDVIEVPVVTPSPTPVLHWPSPHPASPSISLKSVDIEKYDTRKDRIKSAVIPREKPTLPQRPVKSAGTARSENLDPSSLRPKNPTPAMSSHTSMSEIDEVSDSYDRDLKKFGWRMQVHGDPYRMKKTTKRLPYYVKCKEPVIDPEPPKVHMENSETFFYNTIPRRPATFAIHKEWISETIHAKRMELQKREGIKHRWKNFGFVY